MRSTHHVLILFSLLSFVLSLPRYLLTTSRTPRRCPRPRHRSTQMTPPVTVLHGAAPCDSVRSTLSSLAAGARSKGRIWGGGGAPLTSLIPWSPLELFFHSWFDDDKLNVQDDDKLAASTYLNFHPRSASHSQHVVLEPSGDHRRRSRPKVALIFCLTCLHEGHSSLWDEHIRQNYRDDLIIFVENVLGWLCPYVSIV